MQRYHDSVQLDSGHALTGTVTVTNYPGGSAATIYSDDGITPIVGNSVDLDSTGEYFFYAANGHYTLVIETDYGSETKSDVILFDPDDFGGGGGGGSGTVTSVAMSVPALLSVSGSPVTTSGTLAVSYSGAALPVANGGTGVTSTTAYALLFGGTTSTAALQSGGIGTAGYVLTSNGAGAIATFQAIPTTTPTESIIIACGDETTACTTGTAKVITHSEPLPKTEAATEKIIGKYSR